MANVSSSLKDWSATAGSNQPDSGDAATVQADLQALQAAVRGDLATKGNDIASATTTDIGAVAGLFHDITGTTTITGLGAVSAGIWKILKFEGALTLTHNATSLILPGGANITTANGDIGIFTSEGSGNWRCVSFSRVNRSPFGITLGTSVTTTSGTSVTFTGIPPGTRRIEVTFNNVSTNGTSNMLVRIGDSGGIETSGYTGRGAALANTASVSATDYTAGLGFPSDNAGHTLCGTVTLTLSDPTSFNWSMTGVLSTSSVAVTLFVSAAAKPLSAELTQVQVAPANGTDTFDNGSINITYE